MEDNTQNGNFQTIKAVVFLVLFIVYVIWAFRGSSNSTSSLSSSERKQQKQYLQQAVQNLDEVSEYPVTGLSSAKIITYGKDKLIAVTYTTSDIYGSIQYYSSTYSINRKEFIGKIELENMEYTDEWKSAKVTTIEYNIIDEVNKSNF